MKAPFTSAGRTALAIALGYALIAIAWVLLSDAALLWLAPELQRAQTVKAVTFVSVSTVGLYLLLRLFLLRLERAQAQQLRDAAARERAQEKLRLMGKVFEQSSEAIMVADADNRIIAVNEAFSRVTGYAAEEVLGRSPSLLSSGRQDRAFYQRMWNALREHGIWRGEIWNRRKNGEVYPEWLTVSAVADGEGRIGNYLAIFSDLTERKQAEQRIHYLSHFDFLTGLPNRSQMQTKLTSAVERARRERLQVAVLLLDLDRFKLVNESLGHEVGDQLLQAVAQRLGGELDDGQLLGRMGGDSFIVLMPQLERAAPAQQLAERLLAAIASPYRIDGHELNVGCSIGISLYPVAGADANALLKHAETAMFAAKDDGRNRFRLFRQAQNPAAQERLLLENGLHQALAREELLLHYQPQLDLRTGRIVGIEALLRWQHPELGMIPPGKFIPIAEESSLITRLDQWVLREACRQNRHWQQLGLPPVPVSVNLSAMQFREADFPTLVARILADSGLAAEYLELELTEGVIIDRIEQTVASLQALKAMGLKLAIDDFGTGYSSLSYLRRFPLDRLKIDQSFIRQLESDPSNAAITRTIIELGKNLGLRVIGEGVENEAQRGFLHANGCDEIQGYLFSRPLPPLELEALLSRHTALPRASSHA